MNRVGAMTFPDALRKKPFQETDWRFLGIGLAFVILLSVLVTVGNRTLNFPEPVLSEDTAAYYVDLLLETPEEAAPLEPVEVETEGLAVGAETIEEELPAEPEEVLPEEEPVVDRERRVRAQRTRRREAVGARIAAAKEAQTVALQSSGLLALVTVAPTGGGTRRRTDVRTSGDAGVAVFSAADVGQEFTTTADLSKDRRVTSYVGASKEEIKVQMAQAQELEGKMTRADLEVLEEEALAAEALADAQVEVQLSGLSKVEEIAKATPGRDPDAIEAMITRHRAQIAHCYETELRRNPNLRGRIVVRFTVRANGRVTGVRVVQSSMGDANVERCLVGVIRRFRFEVLGRETGNLTYEYPFIFAPR